MPLLSKKYTAVFIIAALGLVAMKPFHSAEQDLPSQETLVIGLQSGYPPFEFMNAAGEIVGFDVEIAEIIADKLHKKLVIKDMEFEGEIISLKQGQIDMIISGMTISPSRQKEILMVPYHGDDATSLSLIFWNEIPPGVSTIEDIANLPNPTISIETGSSPEEYLNRYANIKTRSFPDALCPLMDVKFGKSVANLVEADVAEYLKKQHTQIQILDIPFHDDEAIMGFGIGIKKGNDSLFQQVHAIIQEIKKSGELKQLEDKWFKKEMAVADLKETE